MTKPKGEPFVDTMTDGHREHLAFCVSHDVLPDGDPVTVYPVPPVGLTRFYVAGVPPIIHTTDAATAAALVESGAFQLEIPPDPPDEPVASAPLEDPASAGSPDS